MTQDDLLESWAVVQLARSEKVPYAELLAGVTGLLNHYIGLAEDVGFPYMVPNLAEAVRKLNQANQGVMFTDTQLLGVSEIIHYHCLELEKCYRALAYGTGDLRN